MTTQPCSLTTAIVTTLCRECALCRERSVRPTLTLTVRLAYADRAQRIGNALYARYGMDAE